MYGGSLPCSVGIDVHSSGYSAGPTAPAPGHSLPELRLGKWFEPNKNRVTIMMTIIHPKSSRALRCRVMEADLQDWESSAKMEDARHKHGTSAIAITSNPDVNNDKQKDIETSEEKHAPSDSSLTGSSSPSVNASSSPQRPPPASRTQQDPQLPIWRRIYDFLAYCPLHLRWNPEQPPKFSMSLNVLFGFAGAFTVANLYYSHPILNVLAHDFGVPYVEVSQIPTLAQAGYATGLLFLCPLGDMYRIGGHELDRRLFSDSVHHGCNDGDAPAHASVGGGSGPPETSRGSALDRGQRFDARDPDCASAVRDHDQLHLVA
nr:putative uncharacterized transporter ygay [Quercus suber]